MKEKIFLREQQTLSQYACLSQNTKGRQVSEQECSLRTPFQRDRDRIIHSKAFRRLKNKTQVFLLPEGDHYRTRLTHTLDVMQIARSIARFLDLNEDLAEAIALGHDLGHTPFGHTGERTLARLTDNYFSHNIQSLRIVDKLERDGRGLNLTAEVRDGILNHRTGSSPSTLEGQVVMFADKIAYINHDIDDSIRAGILKSQDLPDQAVSVLGRTANQRINTMIRSIVDFSFNKPKVKMDETVAQATAQIREFMFKKVYTEDSANKDGQKADKMLEQLFVYCKQNPQMMPKLYLDIIDKEGMDIAVCDFISGMSDHYAVATFKNIFIPTNLA